MKKTFARTSTTFLNYTMNSPAQVPRKMCAHSIQESAKYATKQHTMDSLLLVFKARQTTTLIRKSVEPILTGPRPVLSKPQRLFQVAEQQFST